MRILQLCILFLSLVFPTLAAALTFNPSQASVGGANQEFTFDIEIDSVTHLKVFGLTLNYDSTRLQFVKVEAGSLVSAKSPTILPDGSIVVENLGPGHKVFLHVG
jgi:hypothetical protein